jgi:hypothetical protein
LLSSSKEEEMDEARVLDNESSKLDTDKWMFEPCPFTEGTFQLQWMTTDLMSQSFPSTSDNIHLVQMPLELDTDKLFPPTFLEAPLACGERKAANADADEDSGASCDVNEVTVGSFLLNILQQQNKKPITNHCSNKQQKYIPRNEQDWINALKSGPLLNHKLTVYDLVYLLKIFSTTTSTSLARVLLIREDNDILCSILRRSESNSPAQIIKELSILFFQLIELKSLYTPFSKFRHFLLNLDMRNAGGEAGIELENCLCEEYVKS